MLVTVNPAFARTRFQQAMQASPSTRSYHGRDGGQELLHLVFEAEVLSLLSFFFFGCRLLGTIVDTILQLRPGRDYSLSLSAAAICHSLFVEVRRRYPPFHLWVSLI